MTKANLLLNSAFNISERYRVELKVFEVSLNQKYPEGVKARFILIDVLNKVPRLIVDNHAPFGFHVHANLPKEKNKRLRLETSNYLEALLKFWDLVKEILSYEN
ncbi:MAG: hypothetical protein AABY53_03615 [Bdellovibrionota bacterium]